jgi:hypothetical protein
VGSLRCDLKARCLNSQNIHQINCAGTYNVGG